MKPTELFDDVYARLRSSGVSLDRNGCVDVSDEAALRKALGVFFDAARVAVNDPFDRDGATASVSAGRDCDLLLFEVASSSRAGALISLGRQLTLTEDEEYGGMLNLTLTLQAQRGDPDVPREQVWGGGGPPRPEFANGNSEVNDWAGDVDQWIARVEGSPAITGIAAWLPARLRVTSGAM